MCGLAGLLYSEIFFKKEPLIKDTLSHLYNRGPDQSNVIEYDHILLINTRLKIQDLEYGTLPYEEEGQPFTLLYNGELYNKTHLQEELSLLGYTLKENSDSEVVYKILQHFDHEGLSKFDGMFALSFYNRITQEVLIARDRFGVKPLFYSFKDNFFGFSSTPYFLKKLLQPELNREFLLDFIQHNYISNDNSPYAGIYQLPAGTYIKKNLKYLQNNSAAIRPYWNPYSFSSTPLDSNQLSSIIENGIRSQLIGERKIGLFLSSGVDSAIIAGLSKKYCPNLQAFHIHYKGSQDDELKDTIETASLLNIPLKTVSLDSSSFISEIDNFVRDSYLPLADPGAFPLYFLAKSIGDQVTVVLSGDGSDELFAGYPTILASKIHHYLSKLPFLDKIRIPSFLMNLLTPIQRYKVDLFIASLKLGVKNIHAHWRHVFTKDELEQLTHQPSSAQDLAYENAYIKIANQNPYIDELNKLMLADFNIWLPKNNFLKLDIATMSHSLEGRVPFINNNLYYYLFSLSGKEKWSFFKNKVLLRKFSTNLLPSKITQRPKKPFHPPYQSWFKDELHPYLCETLLNSKLVRDYGFNRSYIEILLEEHKSCKKNNTFKIFNLLILEKWLTIHFSK